MTVTIRMSGTFWEIAIPPRGGQRTIVAEALRRMMTAIEFQAHPAKRIQALVASLEDRGLLDVVTSGCDYPRVTHLPDRRPKKIEVGEVIIYGVP